MSSPVTVASHGAAVVFNEGAVKRTYEVLGTKLARNVDTEPIVYVPVVNPESTTFVLDSVLVNFEGGGDTGSVGAVEKVQVAYGGTLIFDSSIDQANAKNLSSNSTGTFTLYVGSSYRIADASSYGINVALTLYLRDGSSFVTLHSVDLTFKEKK